jgi:ABC-type oligopeptide transport system ATPase subunit
MRHCNSCTNHHIGICSLQKSPRPHFCEPLGFHWIRRVFAAIARAIVLDPVMIVADEPVSMRDMSVRSKVLQLMIDLKSKLGLNYIYVTHDLATARFFCDRVAILYLGRIVEFGTVEQIFTDPKHPYIHALLNAIPDPDLSLGEKRRYLAAKSPMRQGHPPDAHFTPVAR